MSSEIIAKTESAGGIFKIPMIEIECDKFVYSNTGIGYHGIQINEELASIESTIQKLCAEISDRML